jgi:ABC transporter with metal-binding/Fe-S-binding domain ATP-binding protein
MFHTPNIDGVDLQAKAMNLPLIIVNTKGEKEKELLELKIALKQAKEEHGIQGITTGAVASQYQASRIQNICHELNLWCINPLWQIEQNKLLQELLDNKFEVLIAGVFAYPFDKNWLGKIIDKKVCDDLKVMQTKYEINPAGEGGEIETFVLDCPLFEKKIKITKTQSEYKNYAGTYNIISAELIGKKIFDIKENKTIKTKEAKILIINTSTKEAPLYVHEFIRPITDLCEKSGKTWNMIGVEEIPEEIKAEKIIISGTALKDNQFLKHKKNIDKLINSGKPILGICAGAELLLPKNIELEEILEIGPKVVEELNEDPLTSNLDGKECYFLHQLGIRAIPLNSYLKALLATKKGIAAFKYSNKKIYGVQFHPEVSQKELIINFLNNI